MDDLMIKAEKVSKIYKLGQIGGTTLRDELQRRSAKRHGREDPTRRIGAREYKDGETFSALDRVSFEVKKGERVGIIGHNGAGKSTLLKLLCRVTAPTDGFIGLNGRIASMLEVGTGFHPELTGRENIYMNGAILGMTRREIDRKIEDIIDFSEVRQFIDTPVKRYSSGMYVKLAFSVAAHLDAEIMIMDEVLAVGDMAFQKKCLEKMSDVSRTEGRTILYVSHNMNTIRQLCDRVLVMDHGHIVFDGGVEEGIGQYADRSEDGQFLYDYSDRHIYQLSRDFELLKLELPGPESGTLRQGESLDFLLSCRANADVADVFLRFELSAADGGVVGTCFSDRGLSAKQGELLELRMSLQTEGLAPGRYRCCAVSFVKDEFGVTRALDRVEPALRFEIVGRSRGNMVWQNRWWGHVRLGDMHIGDVRRR